MLHFLTKRIYKISLSRFTVGIRIEEFSDNTEESLKM